MATVRIYALPFSSNTPFCLQAILRQENEATRAHANLLAQRLEGQTTTVRNLQVSFINTADVTVVVTVFANFQIQIVLDL